MSAFWSGGCQCGAVRYRFTQQPGNAHICHCRMCQKAFGAFYAPLVGGPVSAWELTRGNLSTFMSIGSLDHPEAFPPADQHGIESRIAWVRGLGDLPDCPASEQEDAAAAASIAATNHQHPDHDTATWPDQR